jgi:adenylosuccinate synthase
MLNSEIKKGKRILVEDASSTSMDIDLGIYPFTDSFNTTTGAVCTGLGVPEESIETTIGVFSAISIVKKGFNKRINFFPTQIAQEDVTGDGHNDGDEYLEIKDKLENRYELSTEEYDIGWTDLNMVKHAENTNCLSSIYLTHLDLLDSTDEIKICVGYSTEDGDKVVGQLPITMYEFGKLKAIYKVLPGWKQDTTQAAHINDLPDNAQSFVRFIE